MSVWEHMSDDDKESLKKKVFSKGKNHIEDAQREILETSDSSSDLTEIADRIWNDHLEGYVASEVDSIRMMNMGFSHEDEDEIKSNLKDAFVDYFFQTVDDLVDESMDKEDAEVNSSAVYTYSPPPATASTPWPVTSTTAPSVSSAAPVKAKKTSAMKSAASSAAAKPAKTAGVSTVKKTSAAKKSAKKTAVKKKKVVAKKASKPAKKAVKKKAVPSKTLKKSKPAKKKTSAVKKGAPKKTLKKKTAKKVIKKKRR